MSETPDKPIVRDPDFLPPPPSPCLVHLGQVCACDKIEDEQ